MANNCDEINGTYYLKKCYNATESMLNNITILAMNSPRKPPAEEYFT